MTPPRPVLHRVATVQLQRRDVVSTTRKLRMVEDLLRQIDPTGLTDAERARLGAAFATGARAFSSSAPTREFITVLGGAVAAWPRSACKRI